MEKKATQIYTHHITFKGFRALEHKTIDMINLTIREKHIYDGENGQGKTSIIQAISVIRDLILGREPSFPDGKPRTVVHRDFEACEFEVLIELAGQYYAYQTLWDGKQAFNTRFLAGTSPDSLAAMQATELDPAASDAPAHPLVRWARDVLVPGRLDDRSLRKPAAADAWPKGFGPGGEGLFAFLSNLDETARARVFGRLRRYCPRVGEFRLDKRSIDGQVHVQGDYRCHPAAPFHPLAESADIGRNQLKILALAAIPEFGSPLSLVALDDISAGIAPKLLATIHKDLSGMSFPLILADVTDGEDLVFLPPDLEEGELVEVL